MKLVQIIYNIPSMNDGGYYLTLAEDGNTVSDIQEREKNERLIQFKHLDLEVHAIITEKVKGHDILVQ